uniref:Si:ch1073-90m23.1 n=1 Tax=Sinocyclocheilus rhinocerous TaxID=307959 RepID=A0A673M673_9TELE
GCVCLQGSRLDEQRCEFPRPLRVGILAQNVLFIGDGLPLILPPKSGGYWIDPPLDRHVETSPTLSQGGFGLESYDIMERDSEAKVYQEFFRHRYHHSFTACDSSLGPLVLSVCLEEEENRLRVILRCVFCDKNFSDMINTIFIYLFSDTIQFSCLLFLHLKAPEIIMAFDEHRVSQNFKFGVLYQREGQLTEEDILSNNEESEEFLEFLSILGQTVKLQEFTGFRGGLDVSHGQTGNEAVFTSFHGREIMFHVATKLPFTEGDTQQLQRKRHIGNDIVALVYQEGNTPFISDVIRSHFLHCFIAVRRIKRENEGEGGDGGSFQGSVLREFLLTKLINAEISCYKAEIFSRLELRTRSSLLEALRSELSSLSQCMLGEPSQPSIPLTEGGRSVPEGGGGFIENFKRAIRVRSHSFDTLGVPKKAGGVAGQRPKVSKYQ